jgi:two-component system response regulator (stage 0 sporulation protein F)
VRFESPSHPAFSVLVADDDEDMRSLIANSLRLDGHHVVESRDGAELLERLTEVLNDPTRRPVVIVTDVLMPNLSGLGVLAALRRARWDVPVILMTALDDESVLTVAQRFGVVTLFKKPFNVDNLRTAVLNARLAIRRRSN